MITFKTLENTSTDEILGTFNLSFSDYVIPLCLTKERLESKMLSDSIRLDLSVGAFENEKLIAFILHGFDVVDNLKVVYNAGTGVIPAKRGNRLTTQLFEFARPVLIDTGAGKVVLEVITTNETALKTYQNMGFQITRHFNCFRGSVNQFETSSQLQIRELESLDWQKIQSFWDIRPSWQNGITAVEKLNEITNKVGIYDRGELVGYAVYNPLMKRIYQMAVDSNNRRRGIAAQLLNHISKACGRDLSIINVDDSSEAMTKFLVRSGLNIFIEQFEMELKL